MAANPTNADILKELRSMNARITALESWKIAEDAARKAVTEYRAAEVRDATQKSIMEVLKQLAPFLVAASALVYALLQGVGK